MQLMAERFGVKRTPVPGDRAERRRDGRAWARPWARLIIARGFRITLSQNAESFDKEVTQIVALGEEHLRRRATHCGPPWGWAASRCPR